MIVKDSDEFTASVCMTKEEASVLHDALIIAKLQIGEGLLTKDAPGVDVEYLRGVLAGIAGK